MHLLALVTQGQITQLMVVALTISFFWFNRFLMKHNVLGLCISSHMLFDFIYSVYFQVLFSFQRMIRAIADTRCWQLAFSPFYFQSY